MRNSLLPIAAALLLVAIGALLIRPTVERGQGGPEVRPGILRLPKRDPLRTTAVPLAGRTTAALALGSADPHPWQVVVVMGDDREPTTRAAMLALGEELFQAGVVAVLEPQLAAADPAPPLPLAADRVIRVATRAARIGPGPLDPWQATVAFAIAQPRPPADHPGLGLLPPPALAPTVIIVEHDGQLAAGAAADWPGRWAATGRSIAQAMLATLRPDGVRRAERPSADWGTHLPLPPTTPELRWHGAFQHELTRGWTGRIVGRTVATRDGGSEAAVEPLLRLLKRGAWEELAGAGPWRQWSRLRDGQQQRFAVHDDGDGWTATMWIERPDIPGLVAELIARGERERLRVLRSAPALPEEQRARIDEALAQ